MFPEPKSPVNLLSNLPFTFSQLISINQQCKKYGMFSWILDELVKFDGDLSLFTIYNKQKLKLEAIKVYFSKSSYSIRETVVDFFGAEADHVELEEVRIRKFVALYDTNPDSRLVQRWIKLTKEYYVAKELQDIILIATNLSNVESFLNRIYHHFA